MTPEELIKYEIEKSGMTIKIASTRSGVPYNALQPSLKGRRNLRANEFLALCKLFKVEPERALEPSESA